MSHNDDVPSAEELAEDYRSSLEDLSVNSRWEITNLTVIAKENIHAAQSISKVIEEHIQKTGPARKLPALYLLDSICKNVGTPYTLFFGRNLYRTFMDAYTLVEAPVRRKLEEMLLTWKQPVPGSTSSTPLFPAETTRKIESALIKARTLAVQRQQQQMKHDHARFGLGQPSAAANASAGPGRSTPTPPMGVNGQSQILPYGQPPQVFDGRLEPPQNQGTPQPPSQSVTPVPNLNQINLQQLAAQLGLNNAGLIATAPTTDTLLNDIVPLIQATKSKLQESPWDGESQKRLKALVDLHTILSTQQLPTDQLAQIRDQLSKIAISVNVTPAPPAIPIVVPPPQVTPIPPAPAPPALPNTTNLAALLSNFHKPPPPPPPPPGMPNPLFPHLSLLPPNGLQPSAPPPANDLFASLMSAGLLKVGGSAGGAAAKPNTPFNPMLLMPGILGGQPPVPPSNILNGPSVNWDTLDIELTTASLKINRPHFVGILNESLPNRCGSCPRRFASTEQGKKDKAAHLDWHFRVQQRLADSSKHAQFRSWYVGEEEWIKFREDEDDSAATTNGGVSTGADASTGATSQETSKENYIPVPNDPALANITCPVCKEKFETVWHPDAEEWVWMDAIKASGRIYHASCYAEISKDAGAAPPAVSAPISRGSTPDNLAGNGKGKRKAEQDLMSLLSKMKREK